MKAVIMTGGRGVRMMPYTHVLPKGLLPVGRQPILEIIVKQLLYHGFDTITMACGYLSHLIQAYFGDGSKWGVKIDYYVESEPLGTVAPLKVMPLFEEPFLLLNCDVLTTLDFGQFMQFHKQGESLLTVASQRRRVPIDLGVLGTDGDKVTKFFEKPDQFVDVSMGVYVVHPSAVDWIPINQAFDVPELITVLLQNQQPVRHFSNDAYWLDIGKPNDYERANREFPTIANQVFPGEHA